MQSSFIRSIFSSISTSIFGQISWVPPQWFNKLCLQLRRWQVWAVIAAVIVVGAAGFYAYRWYSHLPKPQQVTAHLSAPAIVMDQPPTPSDQSASSDQDQAAPDAADSDQADHDQDDQGSSPFQSDQKSAPAPVVSEPVIQSLIINFGTETADDSFPSASVAPISQADKTITNNLTISPAIKGKWTWQSDSQISFTPDAAWPAGQKYTVHFERALFSPQTKLAQYSYDFSTPTMQANIMEFNFYQDPINPAIKQAVATINFNYPVNPGSFAKNITLEQPGAANTSSKQYKFTIDYDQYHRTAYLHSETLTLDDNKPYYLQLTIDKGVQPVTGAATTDETDQKLLVPSRNSIFQVNNVSAKTIRNPQNYPDQILNIETSLGVTSADLQKYVHVYQLPKDLPATLSQAAETDHEWSDPGEVTAAIVAQSQPVKLQVLPTADFSTTLHSFKFNAPGKSYLYIKIDKGLASAGNFVLAQDYKQITQAPELPREVMFLHAGSLLALSSEKKVSVLVRGIPAVQFTIARVLPNDINHLVTQTRGKFNSPYFINDDFNQTNISKIFSEVQQFNTRDPGTVQYTALDLDKYLHDQSATQKLGLFLLTVREWHTADKTAGSVKAQRLILITDMGLLVKDNSDGSHDVFVQSIANGTPVANAQVSILGKNGVALLTKTTDAQGHALFPDLKDFKQEREPTVFVAQNKSDIAFMPYETRDRGLNYSKFDVGGLTKDDTTNNLSGYLFSDRGIYRPGDTMHIGTIVKQSYAQIAPANIPLEETIIDPRGTTVLDQKLSLPVSNIFTTDYTLSETSSTGEYTINLYTVKDGQSASLLGSTSVQVQEFLPDRMKINTQFLPTTQTGWVAPLDLNAQVNLQNLFGTPAPNRRITAKLILTPSALQFANYPDYVFTDPLLDPKTSVKTIQETLQETRTDAQGNANFHLDLTRYAKATYQLTFYTEGFESDSGRSVATQKTILVTPLPYLVGYKSNNDLNYLKQNTPYNVHLIAIDPQLAPAAVNNIHAQLFSEQKIDTLVKKPNGTYEYQTVTQESPVSDSTINITKQGLDYALPTTKLGDYIVVLTDSNNTVLSKLAFSVVGNQHSAAEKSTQLSVKLNKTEYSPGEDIQMQITAPYTGAGLISIERDKVYAYKWFKTASADSVQTITVPADFQGDGYIQVAFIRAWDSADIFSNPLSYAVVPFTVNRAAHTVHITLHAATLIQPGTTLPITYSTDHPSKIIIYGVDEGILQVANYKLPDPLTFFFQKHALEVSTQQIVDQILPNYLLSRELSTVGGDGGSDAIKNNLNPFKRKNQLPVVYWSGVLDADQTPRQVNYSVPDYFNGTLHLMAVAVADNAVGNAELKTLVQGDFVITPNIPTFVAPNDTFDISVDVANNLKTAAKNIPVSLKLTASPKLQVVGNSTQNLTINPQSEATVHFKLHALDQLGDTPLTFVASAESKSNKLTEDLSIRPVTPFNTILVSGYSKDKTNIVPLDNLRSEYFQGSAALSSSPLILVSGLQRYLDNFPYSCSEQVVSKAFTAMAMADQPEFIADKNLAQDKIQLAIQILRQRQMSSGAFSYWPGMGENNATKFSTIYAMQFLTEAKERGFNVPNDIFNQGLSYLQTLVAADPASTDDARLTAYAIYILTRNEIVTTNYITNLSQYFTKNDPKQLWQHDITGAYIAASYALLKNTDDATKLIKKYTFNNPSDSRSDFYSPLASDAQYLSIVTRYFPDQAQDAKILLPLTQAIIADDYNTVAAAFSALALSTYTKMVAALPAPEQNISAISNNNHSAILVANANLFLHSMFDNAVQKIQFNSTAPNGYFYQATQAGFAKNVNTTPVKQGLEIYREYRDLKGNPVSNVALGDEIEVHISVRSLSDNTLSNIAIVDLLPGGFEVVRDSLGQGILDYFDVREDRVLFFTSVGPQLQQIVYHIRATNKGEYIVPPILAASMYNTAIKAMGVAGKMVVG